MSKVILILSDALRYDVAVANMGFLGHLVETKLASLYKIVGELPSMSRPMYETVHTGVPSSVHGIVANSIVKHSSMPNVFRLVSEAGMVTAAAAYYWISELYNRAPYSRIDDKEIDDKSFCPFSMADFIPRMITRMRSSLRLPHISSAGFHLIIFCFIRWAWIITAKPLALIRRNIVTMPSVRICGLRR